MKRWVTRDLASFAVEQRFEDYPQEVINKAKILLMDNIGCMLGGSQTVLGRAILSPIRAMGGNPEATLVGGGRKVPTIQAAFVNGTTANALDYDEVLYGIGHPGSTVIPSALAIGEWVGASGRDVLNAILIGYDVGDRIGIAIQPSYERLQQVWGVGTWQTFGSVAAAGKLLKFDLDRMLNAFGVAGATAPVPDTQKWGWDLEERPIHWVKEPTGWPAWTGTTAAVLAANGFVGNRYILDGHNGFWVMAGSDRCDYEVMTKGLGEEFEVEQIAIKPYSACRWQHPALDGLAALREANRLEPEDVGEIVVRSFAWVKRQEIYEPAGMVDAEFSLPYTLAMVLSGYQPGPEWYTEDKLQSKEVLALARKARVEVDPDLDKAYFDRDQLAARVEVVTVDGRRLQEFVDLPKGDPKNPLSQAELEEKFSRQAAYCLEDTTIDAVLAAINDFEKIDNIAAFMTMLAGKDS